MLYWAAREKPTELRGIIMEKSEGRVKITSWILGKIIYPEEEFFKEKMIEWNYNNIDKTLIEKAEYMHCPIETSKGTFKLKIN